MSIAEKLTTIAENEQKVYDAGKKEQYDLFWDVKQNYGSAADYEFAFYKMPAELFKPKYDFVMSKWGAGYSAFAHCQMTDLQKNCDLTRDYQGPQYTFNGCKNLVNARAIKLGHDNPYVGMFSGCVALEEVRIEGVIRSNGLSFKDAVSLSKTSIESVVEHLSDTTSGLKVTFSLTAVNKAFETSNDAADGSTSDEWLVLIATKSNWTIATA